jgi:predicted restriction endonuclease
MEQKKYHDRGEQKRRRGNMCASLGIQLHEYESYILSLYSDNMMSAQEIADHLFANTGESITARSIQRLVKKYGETRHVGDAFRNAVRRGRVQWHYKEGKIIRKRLNKTRRYEILKRDGYKCILCGATSQDDLLGVYHIVPVHKGGDSQLENLWTLCQSCNFGRCHAEK